MTDATASAAEKRQPRPRRQAGYAATIVIDAIFLFLANNVLSWDVLPWLTEDFDDVLAIMNVSLIASIVVNVVYLVFDPPVFRSVCELCLLVVTISVGVTMYRVFPFDFSGYAFDWALLTRWAIGITVFAMCIGFVATAAQLVGELAKRVDGTQPHLG